jgi:hypothetical protein
MSTIDLGQPVPGADVHLSELTEHKLNAILAVIRGGLTEDERNAILNALGDMTIEQWCLKRNRSKTTFYNLKKKGLAPEVLDPPGGGGPRITQRSDRDWEEDMLRLGEQQKSRRKAERRSKMAAEAGRLAAKSPHHHSNRKRQG